MENIKQLRWGILGAGIIAHRMADALALHEGSNLYAVASRTPSKADAFVAEYNGVRALSYEELVQDPAVDVVYVATTHNFHFENARLALEHGKHVIIEKPFTVNAGQAEELVRIARVKKLFLMEAIWVRFLPSLRLLKSKLKEGIVGEVRLIDISFGGFVPPQYEKRLITPELAGGVTLDMGIYPISVACYLLGELPVEIKSMAKFSKTGVDELAAYQFRFPSGAFATIKTSFNLKTEKKALVYGSEGYLEMPDFPVGESFTLYRHDGTNDVLETRQFEESNGPNGFEYQVTEAVRCIREGIFESEIIPLDETVAIMEVMDRMRAEWEFKYPFE